MINCKKVRIQPKEWIFEQEKGDGGYIRKVPGNLVFSSEMQKYAGKISEIRSSHSGAYEDFYYLEIDDGASPWTEWMFDLSYDYSANGPLSNGEAIRAMMAGETLYSNEGNQYFWNKKDEYFYLRFSNTKKLKLIYVFDNLYRQPVKHARFMMMAEAVAWAKSDDSLGWMARISENNVWNFPRHLGYSFHIADYQRARLLPDLSGIDESTVQGFEVEE
jgi:hypothetical protein